MSRNYLPILQEYSFVCLLHFKGLCFRCHAQHGDQSPAGPDFWREEPSYEKVSAHHVLVPQVQAHKPLPRPPASAGRPSGPGSLQPESYRKQPGRKSFHLPGTTVGFVFDLDICVFSTELESGLWLTQ